jgi:hypothetical protein
MRIRRMAYRKMDIAKQWPGNLTVRENLRELGIDGRLILK